MLVDFSVFLVVLLQVMGHGQDGFAGASTDILEEGLWNQHWRDIADIARGQAFDEAENEFETSHKKAEKKRWSDFSLNTLSYPWVIHGGYILRLYMYIVHII